MPDFFAVAQKSRILDHVYKIAIIGPSTGLDRDMITVINKSQTDTVHRADL